MRKKLLTSLLIIGLAGAAIGGGTLAWFTAQAEIAENKFVAGTVKIEAGDSWTTAEGQIFKDNWNPGDCESKVVTVENTGSKKAYIRVKITETWTFLPVGDNEAVVITKHGRDAANVGWSVNGTAWPCGEWTQLEEGDGYWYYNGAVAPEDIITVLDKVCLDAATGNEYQGATYTINMVFEAIQTTNGAVKAEWGAKYDSTSGWEAAD